MKDYDKLELERKVYNFLKENPPGIELVEKVSVIKKSFLIWQAYIETVDALGMMWKCFGRESRGISDLDYSLAHIMLFKKQTAGEKRVIVFKMESLMKERPFMRSEEALELFKELI